MGAILFKKLYTILLFQYILPYRCVVAAIVAVPQPKLKPPYQWGRVPCQASSHQDPVSEHLAHWDA